MEEIITGLYLGSDDDVAEAKKRGYARLAVCKDGPDGHRSLAGYTTLGAPKGKDYLSVRNGDHMALNIIDSDDPAMIPDKVIEVGLAFIKEQMEKGHKILVHCNHGVSRSPSFVLLYLHSIGELSQGYKRALHIFRTLYPKYEPKHGIEYHVRSRW